MWAPLACPLSQTATELVVAVPENVTAAAAPDLATVIALAVGLTAGYLQGWVDDILSFFTNLALVIPVLPLIIALVAYSRSAALRLIVFVIGITSWAARRPGQAVADHHLRNRDFVTAAKFSGEGMPHRVPRDHAQHDLAGRGELRRARPSVRSAPSGLAVLGLGDSQISWGRCSTRPTPRARRAGAVAVGVRARPGAVGPDRRVLVHQLRCGRVVQPAPARGLSMPTLLEVQDLSVTYEPKDSAAVARRQRRRVLGRAGRVRRAARRVGLRQDDARQRDLAPARTAGQADRRHDHLRRHRHGVPRRRGAAPGALGRPFDGVPEQHELPEPGRADRGAVPRRHRAARTSRVTPSPGGQELFDMVSSTQVPHRLPARAVRRHEATRRAGDGPRAAAEVRAARRADHRPGRRRPALDPGERLRALQSELGFAVLFISHDIGTVLTMADRVMVMYGGEIVENRTARERLRTPGTRTRRVCSAPMPTPRRDRARSPTSPGRPPNLSRADQGCLFAPRCPSRSRTVPRDSTRRCWPTRRARGLPRRGPAREDCGRTPQPSDLRGRAAVAPSRRRAAAALRPTRRSCWSSTGRRPRPSSRRR